MSSSLSAEQVAQLAPLLGSVARMLVGGTLLSERSLLTLLKGLGLEHSPEALEELRRWRDLLNDVQQEPTAEQRHATVEALLVRGLPEATVVLAVASVVGGSPAPTLAPARLQASVANLDFGTLRSGQGAALELDVQGGPGQVSVESDQLQVTPPQFGAGTTRLRVTVRPLASGLLWTSLKLVTAGETLEVPVTAQWQATVAPTPPVQPAVRPVVQQPPPTVVTLQPSGYEHHAPPRAVQPPVVIAPPASARRGSGGRVWLLVGLMVTVLLVVVFTLMGGEVSPAFVTIRSGLGDGEETPTALPAWTPAMVKVPAGPFLMGSTDQQIAAVVSQGAHADWVKVEKSQHTLTLPDYWIGKTEVTNAQFRPFVDGDGYTNQAYWTAAGWAWRQAENITQPACWDDAAFNGATQPVVCVSWFEAVAYCRWLSTQTGIEFRLPSEAEWEKAARGSNGLIYPWGNTWDASLVNSSESGLNKTMPVGSYPKGASPSGALDMAGNVWEWCATQWQKPYPYQIEDEWQTAYLEATADSRVLRGGSSWDSGTFVRGAFRSLSNLPRDRYDVGGLRVASHSLVPGSDS